MQYRLKLSLGILLTMSGAVNLHAMEDASDAAREIQIVEGQQDKKRKEPASNDNNVDFNKKKMKSEQDDDQANSFSGGQYAKVAVGTKTQTFQPIGDRLHVQQLDHLRAPTASVATVRAESVMPDDIDWWWERSESRAPTVQQNGTQSIANRSSDKHGEYFP